ncbi:MAG: SCO family protein [Nibricoccus sp.]
MSKPVVRNKTYLRLTLLVNLLLAILLSPGCAKKNDQAADSAKSEPTQKRYPLTGEVLAIDNAAKTLRVRHDEIKGLMPAMTMDFDVSAGDLAIATPGRRIRAELVEIGQGEFKLEKIWPADAAEKAIIDSAANALGQETVIRGKKAYREVGEQVPEFALYDQTGRVVKSERFRGKQIMLNFIFTRCQVAKMCPAAVARFQQLQQLARDAGVANLELISISLDPANDTPGVLKQYALERQIDTSNYTFLTGPEASIKSLLAQFGVLAEFKDNILNHTATTLLIDASGKIVHRADGSMWDVQEFLGKLRKT